MKRLHCGVAALFALLFACTGQAQSKATVLRDEPAPDAALTSDQQARRKAYIENRMATRLALLNASEGDIRRLLAQCRSAIHARALESAAGRSMFLIDPPATQQTTKLAHAVGASVASIEERWKQFEKVPGRKISRGQLDLAWAVAFGEPTGGPDMRAARYACEVDRHLAVTVRP